MAGFFFRFGCWLLLVLPFGSAYGMEFSAFQKKTRDMQRGMVRFCEEQAAVLWRADSPDLSDGGATQACARALQGHAVGQTAWRYFAHQRDQRFTTVYERGVLRDFTQEGRAYRLIIARRHPRHKDLPEEDSRRYSYERVSARLFTRSSTAQPWQSLWSYTHPLHKKAWLRPSVTFPQTQNLTPAQAHLYDHIWRHYIVKEYARLPNPS